MSHRLQILLTSLALAVGCERSTVSPASDSLTPIGPSAPVTSSTNSGSVVAANAGPGRQDVLVHMQDACDPKTFNAALGPGTCTRAGGVQFEQFIAQLTRLGFVGPWHFSPPTAQVHVGQSFVAVNKGGEVHTFTEVAQFGGGIVPSLNRLAHLSTVAPECKSLESDDFVRPGGMYREEIDDSRMLKFQCCIHPWMRLEASSR